MKLQPDTKSAAMELTVNGKPFTVDVPGDMPLLWVLRDVIGLTGTKFGCGIAACGACTVHLDGQPIRSCVTPVRSIAGYHVSPRWRMGYSRRRASGSVHCRSRRRSRHKASHGPSGQYAVG